MSIEPRHLTIGNENQGPNAIDAEFDALESDFPPEDRMELIRALFDEVFHPPLSRENFYRHLSRIHEQGAGQIKHFFLPDIPGGTGDIKTIREGYDTRSEYLKSSHRMFVKVGQGEMWVIPKSEKPYFQISMSECSALVGADDNQIVIAHISYSAINEIQAAVEFMNNMGIRPKNIHAFASVGEFQNRRSIDEHTKRAVDGSVYTSFSSVPLIFP